MQRRIVIAGPSSGSGKTTLTIGLMAALAKKGFSVQGFKCGPDYIDPTYHSAVTGRVSRNLDSWMLSKEALLEIFVRGSRGADIAVIEGMMGLYDGFQPTSNTGSTAEISQLTKTPVLFVLNCENMARSAAAVVKGFQVFADSKEAVEVGAEAGAGADEGEGEGAGGGGVRIAAVIANKVAGEGHFQLIREAVEQECGIPVIGYLTSDADIQIPERHLGLIPSIERGDLHPLFDALADKILATVDLDRLLKLAEAEKLYAEPLLFPGEGVVDVDDVDNVDDVNNVDDVDNGAAGYAGDSINAADTGSSLAPGDGSRRDPAVRIAVARDAAFHFYYPENLELLEARGAECVFFSPLAGERVPEGVQGLYIGGGFPEEFADELSRNAEVRESVRKAVEAGLPTFAECGGLMYLTEAVVTREGLRCPMVGLIPGEVRMQSRLAALGYRQVRGYGEKGNFLLGPEDTARGHEYHYSTFVSSSAGDARFEPAYETESRFGRGNEGFQLGNLVTGYTHLHFASNPSVVDRWIQKCREVGQDVRG